MARVKAPLVALALLSLGAFCACSTALTAYPPADEDREPNAAGALGQDAGTVRQADAGRTGSGAGERDPRLPETDASVADDVGDLPCEVHDSPDCPAALPRAGSPCVGLGPAQCAYADEDSRDAVLVATCGPDVHGRLTWSHSTAACRHLCFGEIPASFEEINSNDCSTRDVSPCDRGFVTDQQAVDSTLARLAEECGMTEYHLGLILSRDGCARALFSSEIDQPEIKCIGRRLHTLRFGCAPTCVLATSDPVVPVR